MIMSKALTSSIIIPCFSECEYCQTTLALEYHGFKVDSFNDPQEALSKFEPGLYDLVILNIEMPKMDGFELYHEIKKESQQR
jgi:DNA-binding response OmpR family regulator